MISQEQQKQLLSEFALKTPQKKESLQALWRLLKILLNNLNFDDVVFKVVNSILTELGYLNLGYRIVVLSLIDESSKSLRRIALSQTPEAERAKAVSTVPFEKIAIPLNAVDNYCVKVLYSRQPLYTSHWPDILSPPLTPEAALRNQEASGIKTSMVYPVFAQNKPIGSLIFSMIKEYSEVSEDEKDLLLGFTDLVGLAVQNSLLFTSLQNKGSQLNQANRRLKEIDQLKDDFVSIASHELRTPMTAVRSYAWMALHKSDVPLSDKLKKYLERTLVSTERLINLVNDMLNVSRIESGRLEIVPQVMDLQNLIGEVLVEIDAKAKEKNLHIDVTQTQIPKIFADPNKVHQVLLNLLGNSLKFTRDRGKIAISYLNDGYFVEVSISDDGVGIAKEDLVRLFKKFSRLDNSYVAASSTGGTGLGLFICKGLVELMKGKIWAKSDGENKGTTFVFSLPIATPQVLKEAEKYHYKPDGEAKLLEPVAIQAYPNEPMDVVLKSQ